MKQTKEAITWLDMPEQTDLPEDMQTLFSKAKHALGEVPNVFRVFGLAPKHFMKWFKYYDYLMRMKTMVLMVLAQLSEKWSQ